MLTAARALNRARSTGQPLPEVAALAPLYEAGCRPKKGQMTLLTGMPKAGKSLFGLWWVVQMDLPTLYFSADMDAHEAMIRLAAMQTGTPSDEVGEELTESWGYELYTESVRDVQVQWVFDSQPDLFDMQEELEAYVEAHGVYPEVIVVDNLMNIQGDGGEDEDQGSVAVGMQGILKALHGLARQTGAAIFVIHHVSENTQRDTTIPSPRLGIQGKVSQLPEVILTVALRGTDNRFAVACVGNRSGKCDASGKTFIQLLSQPELCRFSAWTELRTQAWSYNTNTEEQWT